ncbi:hypothetical protein [Alienimonas chondri]|uniref:Uncharacterized protein n=1 Tax=Alienimonas chondri TaxID=2681879 RepID=A0ABX1VFF0_9PLAN|nr:hypothetical protein [Alienimonas chondri]NNJ26595.1 hypothetical protein [Alienimonas chondri]
MKFAMSTAVGLLTWCVASGRADEILGPAEAKTADEIYAYVERRFETTLAKARAEVAADPAGFNLEESSLVELIAGYALDVTGIEFKDDGTKVERGEELTREMGYEVSKRYVKLFAADPEQPDAFKDLAWVLSAIPQSRPLVGSGPISDRSFEAMQYGFYRAFAERLIRDPAARKRYLWFAAYLGNPYHHTLDGGRGINLIIQVKSLYDNRGFGHSNVGAYYWRDAFAFVVLLEAFGKTSLLKEMDPAKLEPATDRFYDWITESFWHLVPREDGLGWEYQDEAQPPRRFEKDADLDRRFPPLKNPPKTPFPDWPEKLPAPDRLVIRSW